MMKTIKVMLCPNNRQKTKLFACAGTARFVYNWALGYEKKNYEAGNKFISDGDLRKILTVMKLEKEYQWLNDYSNNIPKQAIKGWQLCCHSAKQNSPKGLPKDAVRAYQNFFKGIAEFPKFKSRKKSRPSFYMDTSKISFTSTHVKLEKLTTSKKRNKQKFNFVKLSEPDRIPVHAKYSNPRITFDGLNWWISVGIESGENTEQPTNQGIGIDIGIKEILKKQERRRLL